MASACESPAQPTIAEALDATGLPWTTGGQAYWFGLNDTNAYDGEDAAQSGSIGDDQLTWVETSLTGPGVMGFSWKVASEQYFDALEVIVNGDVVQEISGDQDWTTVELELPAGNVVIRWQYRKDASYSEAPDMAWLDSVSFVSAQVVAPSIVSQPQDRVLTAGSASSLSVEAAGTETLHYQWRLDGTNLVDGAHVSGSSSRVLSLLTVETNQSGLYSVTVSNSAGVALSSNALVTVNPPVPLPAALDAPTLSWITGGSKPWVGQQTMTYDGVDAAQSGSITDLEETWIYATVEGPGRLLFWWKVSSEAGFDELTFSVDGFPQGAISGEVGWTEVAFDIPTGNHELRWTYAKDIDTLSGQDVGWVDQVIFVQYPQVTSQPKSQTVVGGSIVEFQPTVIGDPPLAFQWMKDGLPLPAATNQTLTLSSVARADSGTYALIVTNVAGSTLSSNALVVVRVPQLLTPPIRQPDGSILLKAHDADGNLLQPQHLAGFSAWSSTNCLSWELLPGTLSLSNGWLWLHDTNAPAFARRFYQIREP